MLPLILILNLFWSSCNPIDDSNQINYREEMRGFVQEIAEFSRDQDPDFLIIPQNGHELLMKDQQLATSYINSVSGVGQESLFYGYPEDDQRTLSSETNELLNQLSVAKQYNLPVLVTDYCFTAFKVNNSFTLNQQQGFISFAAPERELTVIPDFPSPLPGENSNDIRKLSEAQNFLYLLNKQDFTSKEHFISALEQTNYDVLIVGAFFWGDIPFTAAEINRLKTKKNGGERLVISYMSIGEAEDYRYYWKDEWNTTPPAWLVRENPDWEGNFKVQYWDPEWKALIYGNEDSYTQKVLDAGFDGVYLDIVDAFEFFESR